MLRKVLAVLLSALMLAMSMAVYATEAEHVHEEGCACAAVETVTEVQPRAAECGNCGKMTLVYVVDRTTTTTKNVNCTHGAAGYDAYRVVTTYYHYDCSNCNFISDQYSSKTETLTYCPLY